MHVAIILPVHGNFYKSLWICAMAEGSTSIVNTQFMYYLSLYCWHWTEIIVAYVHELDEMLQGVFNGDHKIDVIPKSQRI